MEDLNSINHLDLIDTDTACHPVTPEFTSSSCAHGILTKVDSILDCCGLWV